MTTPPPPRRIVLFLLGFLLGWPTSTAARDPALRWYTLTTPHFEIHHHEGARHLAVRISRAAEAALDRMSRALDHMPSGRIQLVVSDEVDSANGSAQVLPYNIVHVYATAPGELDVLNDYDDFLWILLVHELTHIVHMDTVSGIPAIINWVFGRTAYPNGAQPVWFIEGLAIHYESALSSAGRIRSSLFRMYLRTAALAGSLDGIDVVSGTTRDWPQGTLPYLVGAFFVEFLVQRYGQHALTNISHHMGGTLIPWCLNVVARRELDRDYLDLFREWTQLVTRRARHTLHRLEEQGLTAVRQLTHRGQRQQWPRISPGGDQILYFAGSADRWPSLRLVDREGRGDRRLVEVNSGEGASFAPDGLSIVFSQSDVVDQFYFFNDLYRLDLQTGRTERLSHGLRARSPDISPDGRTVAFVRNKLARTQIALLDLTTGTHRDLTRFEDGTQVESPRFGPDGRRIVFSASAPGGGRNLMLIDVADGDMRRLTEGRFMDISPVFSTDGRRILFSSDRGGIFNIHALDLEYGHLTRLTNVATGVFCPEPAPDGSGMALVLYGPEGYDIGWVDFPVDEHPVLAGRPPRPPPADWDRTADYPVAPYTPWSTLLPRSWFPVFGKDSWGSTYGVLVSGGDVLGKLGYNASVHYGPAENQLYLEAGAWAHVLYPTLSAYVSRRVDRYYRQAILNDRYWAVDKEHITLFFDVAFPFSRIRRSHFVFFNYDLHLYDRWTQVPLGPMDTQPVLPDDSNLAWFAAGWSFSSVRSYIRSISAEEGLSTSISLRYSDPSIGSGSRIAEARFSLRTYFPVWRAQHHVLALGLRGGISVGDPRRKSVYSIGGLPIRDPIQDAYFGYRYGGLYLRGYPPGAFWGSVFVLGSAEYRMPLWIIEKGVFTLPFYLRQLHLALFCDAGGTAVDSFPADALKVGVGAELRLDLLLAYYLPMTLRLGYGRGLSAGGKNNFFLTMGWGF